jgi:hypothetical protein
MAGYDPYEYAYCRLTLGGISHDAACMLVNAAKKIDSRHVRAGLFEIAELIGLDGPQKYLHEDVLPPGK